MPVVTAAVHTWTTVDSPTAMRVAVTVANGTVATPQPAGAEESTYSLAASSTYRTLIQGGYSITLFLPNGASASPATANVAFGEAASFTVTNPGQVGSITARVVDSAGNAHNVEVGYRAREYTPGTPVDPPDPGTPGSKAVELFGTPRSGLKWHSGAYTGGTMSAANANSWGAWRGTPLDFLTVYPTYDTWSNMASSQWVFDLTPPAQFGGRLNYGLPLLPTNRAQQWSDVTSGAYDSVFRGIAQGLKATFPNSAVRIGFEVQGDWFPWATNWATRETFKTAYRRVAGIVKDVEPQLKTTFGWNVATIPQGMPGGTSPAAQLAAYYPGDDVVDIIELDTYDFYQVATGAHTQASWDFHVRPAPGAGLLDIVEFAAAHDKGWSIGEWGLHRVQGPGDNPFFIEKMWDFCVAHADTLAYECYFNEPASYIANDLQTQNPSSGAAYRARWGRPDAYPGGGTPPTQGSTTWPLTVSADKRRFQYTSGTAFFYCADTAWALNRLSVADAKRYADIKANQGFNVLQISCDPFGRNSSGARGAPFVGGDLTNPNLSYWNGFDEIIDYLATKGMLASLLPLWMADNGGWAGGSLPSTGAFSTYCTWLGNRYKAKGNIVWAFGGDEQYSQISAVINAGAAALEAADPNHLKTYHPRWNSYELRTASWLDYNSMQHNDNASPMTYEDARTGIALSPTKPYLNAEPPYYPDTAMASGSTSRKRNRFNGWGQPLGGALGVVYGGPANGTWGIGGSGGTDWNNTAHVTGADTGNIRKILSQYRWDKLTPNWDSTVITSSRGSYGSTSYITCARAGDGSLIAMYLPNGGSVTVALGQLAGAGTAYWHDPTTGATAGTANVSGSGSQTFTPPGNNSAGDNDWCLVLATSAGKAT